MRAGFGRVVLAVMLSFALGTVAGSTTATSAASSTTASTRPADNPNWSGYVAVACGTCRLRYVAAAWHLPAVNCAVTPFGWADDWVGLDGFTSGSVEQVGTASICTPGQPVSYLAWWEMYPDSASISWGTIRPGDLITASVYYDATSRRWWLDLLDHATGTAIHTGQPCPRSITCANVDAEAITEAPAAGHTVPLADFGSTGFSSIRVTSRNGTRGDMASNGLWSVVPVDLVGSTGRLLASPGPTTGAAFTVTWHAAQ